MSATMFGLDVHWGLCFGVLACLGCYVLMDHTTFGFAARMAGGNVRAWPEPVCRSGGSF